MARYRGPSDASVAISGILSGLATIERGYRADAREKDRFREALILQDRKTQYLGEQARSDRDLRKFEFQWKTLTDEKKYALDKLETLDAERSQLGVSDEQWKTLKYFDQTKDFEDISSAFQSSNDEQVDNALFSYTDTDKQISNLMTQVDNVNQNVRISRELNRKIRSMSGELSAELPGFYEQYRDASEPGVDLTDVERMEAAFDVDDDERTQIYDALKLQSPDMFGDIDTNPVLQDLVRREISTQYSPSIARAKDVQTLKSQLDQSEATAEANRVGDYDALASSLEQEAQLALIQVGTTFQNLIFPPGEDGIALANDAIEQLLKDLKSIPGFPEGQAKAISEAIVSTKQDQMMTTIGPLMAGVFNTIAESTDVKDVNNAKLIKAALEKSNVYGYMQKDAQKKFTDNLELFFNRREMLQKTMSKKGAYLIDKLGINEKKKETPASINTDAALKFINENAGDEGDDKPVDFTYDDDSETAVSDSVESDSTSAVLDSLNVIDSTEVPIINNIINKVHEGEVISDFSHLPMWGDEYNPPPFMENYDFGGYSKPGVFGIGGGVPMWINKESGAVTSTPSEMTSFAGGPDDRQLYQAYEMQLEADYRGASEYRDALADLAEATAKSDRIKSAFDEGHPRRNQRLLQINSEITQIQESLNAMELASPQYIDMKYYEGQ